MVVDKCVGRCLDVGSTPTGSIFKNGRLLKRLKRLCWKRSRRVKACVGSNPMSSVISCKKRYLAFFLFVKGDEGNLIILKYEYFWKCLKTISTKK